MRAACLLYFTFSEAAAENYKRMIQIQDKICYLWLLMMWLVHL